MTFDPGLVGLLHTLLMMLWRLFVAFWPLWLLLALPSFTRAIFAIFRRARLARAGMQEIDAMDGVTFEQYLDGLFCKLGYHVEQTRRTGDYGADLILTRHGTRTIVQAKRYSKNVGVRAVQEVVAARPIYRGTHTMVVTNRRYTKQARHLARKNMVLLWDRDDLAKAILSAQKSERMEVDREADRS